MFRCIALAALLMMALLQTSCTVTGLDILQWILLKNDATPPKPLWKEEPVMVGQASAPDRLPDLQKADPKSLVAAAR
jgi:hypothetical protein